MSSQADSSRGITNGGKTIRCRIQWLGGSSKFLVARTLGPNQLKVAVIKAKGVNGPPESEWSIRFRRDSNECTIQPTHDNTRFLSATHRREAYLAQAAAYPVVQKVDAPSRSISSEAWGDSKDEWVCTISFPGLGMLGVPSNVEGKYANIRPHTHLPTKKEVWRIHVLSEESKEVEEISMESEPLATLTQPTPEVNVRHTFEGRRCHIVSYNGGSPAYLQAGSRDSLLSLKAEGEATPTEWVINPSESFYTIQLANDAKYLAFGSQPHLSRSPEQWNIEKRAVLPSFRVENIQEEWTCSIHPATNNQMALKLNRSKVTLQNALQSNLQDQLTKQWRWHVLFLKDLPPTMGHGPQSEPKDGTPDVPLGKQLHCRILFKRSSKVYYLASTASARAARGNLARLVLLSQDRGEWILTPNGNKYTLNSGQGNPEIPADTTWFVEKVPFPKKKMAQVHSPDAISHFISEIRQDSWGQPALVGMIDKDEKDEGYGPCGLAVKAYHVQVQPWWHVEVLREGVVPSVEPIEQDGEPSVNTPSLPQKTLLDAELTVTDEGSPQVQQWTSSPPSVTSDDSLYDNVATEESAKDSISQSEMETTAGYEDTLNLEEDSPATARKCRIQHILTGRYLVARTSSIEVAEFAGEDGWILKTAGPGCTFFMPDSASSALREQYLAPGACDHNGNIKLCLSEFPATWDLSEKYNRYTECSNVELAEWICKIRWPFTGQYLLSDLAHNNDSKSVPGAQFLVWMGRNGAGARLDHYWRIQFLL